MTIYLTEERRDTRELPNNGGVRFKRDGSGGQIQQS